MSRRLEDVNENVKLLQSAFGVAVEPPTKTRGYYILKTGARNIKAVMETLRPFAAAAQGPFPLAWGELTEGGVSMSLAAPSANACVLVGPEAFSRWRDVQQSRPG